MLKQAYEKQIGTGFSEAGMGTAWKEKLWKLGGSEGMLPRGKKKKKNFSQKIQIYAIWGYP